MAMAKKGTIKYKRFPYKLYINKRFFDYGEADSEKGYIAINLRKHSNWKSLLHTFFHEEAHILNPGANERDCNRYARKMLKDKEHQLRAFKRIVNAILRSKKFIKIKFTKSTV